jgi:alkylation response protein AidB-like acyl-CoA dehydrogenase
VSGDGVADLSSFQSEIRAWLEANCPASMRTPAPGLKENVWGGRRSGFPSEDARIWLERCVERGFTVPEWPTAYGGAGLSKEEARALRKEMKALGCRAPLFNYGISMLAPVLFEYGSEEQKREHLPPIARGEIRWCQGYSEPGAGSDLANVQCRAVRDGDDYVVNGQKIWTSDADFSDWIFCLVRTDPDAPKHDGISFLLIDMESPGISVSPIPLISGASPFCQTFFDDVRVPARHLIGQENGGWTLAKRLLQHERAMLSDGTAGGGKRESLVDVARRALGAPSGPLPDATLRDELVQLQMDRLCYRATIQRSTDAARAGQGMGPETSMFKLYLSEMGQRSSDWRQRVVGAEGLGWDGDAFSEDELKITRDWLYGKASTILGGTSEIQLNIIAKRVLGLPD